MLKEKQSPNKNPFFIFTDKLSYEEYDYYIKKLVRNFNPNADKTSIDRLYEIYLNLFDSLEKMPWYRINTTNLGLFSKTQANLQYWIDRGWSENESLEKRKKRQSTCTPEIAKKIQATLNSKSKEEIAIINKKKGNALNVEWLMENKKLSYEQAKEKIFNQCSNAGKIKNTLYKKLGKAVSNRQLEFYIEKGLTLEESKKALAERQNTTSIKSYILKYGIKEGTKRYESRIEKFKNNWIEKSDEEKLLINQKRLIRNNFFSNESFIFFKTLEEKININIKCLYGESEYFLYDNINKTIYFYDFCIPELKIMIEYHGSFWHANESKDSSDWSCPFYTYEDSLQRDHRKKLTAERNGYLYYIIWDYQRNDIKIINNILNTLNKLNNGRIID